MGGIFGSKPSDSHVVWRAGRDDDGKKKFDFEYLELWAAHFGVDYEEWTRTDHERGDEPRAQHVCIFHRATSGGETFALGDEEWTMGQQRTPRTFVELDEAGVARIKGWTSETVVDIDELVLDGTTFTMKTAEGTVKKLDARRLADRPDPSEA